MEINDFKAKLVNASSIQVSLCRWGSNSPFNQMNSVKREVKVGKKEQKHITGLIVNEDSNGKEISMNSS